MHEFELEKRPLQAALEAGTTKQQSRGGGRGRTANRSDNLLQRLYDGSGSIQAKLAQLKADGGGLYGEAMMALQARMGNLAVSQLHDEVSQASSATSALEAADLAQYSTDRSAQRRANQETRQHHSAADFSSLQLRQSPQPEQIQRATLSGGAHNGPPNFAPGQFKLASSGLPSHDFASLVQQHKSAGSTPKGRRTEAPFQRRLAQRKAGSTAASGSTASNGLPSEVREKMEAGLGADFSGVKIHADSARAPEVGALAYTQGEEIHFAPGQYDPNSISGQELLGHELQHVVQQRDGRVRPTASVAGMPINDDRGLEAEADRMGALAARSTAPSATGAAVPPTASEDVEQHKSDPALLPAPGQRKANRPGDCPHGGGCDCSAVQYKRISAATIGQLQAVKQLKEVTLKIGMSPSVEEISPKTGGNFGFFSHDIDAKPLDQRIAKLGKTWYVSGNYLIRTGWSVDDLGRTDVSSGQHRDVLTRDTFWTAVKDLEPDGKGIPRRWKFWNSALTSQHENFHEHDWFQNLIKKGLPAAGNYVKGTKIDSADEWKAKRTLKEFINKLEDETNRNYDDGGTEDRAYGDGSSGYSGLASSIKDDAEFFGAPEYDPKLNDPPKKPPEPEPEAQRKRDPMSAGNHSLKVRPVQRKTQTAPTQGPIQRTAGGGTEYGIQLAGNLMSLAKTGEGTISKAINWSPVPGVDLTQITLNLDGDALASGTVTGSLKVGEYVQSDSISLSVDANGNVSAKVNDAKLTVGDLISGTINCAIGTAGTTGTARIKADQLKLPLGLTVSSGNLDLTLSADGKVSATGELKIKLPGIGTLTLSAQLQDKNLTGGISLEVTEEVRPIPGVKVTSGTITGNYDEKGFDLKGQVAFDVKDWAAADVKGSLKWPSGMWGVDGTVRQSGAKALGALTISKGEVSAKIVNGTPKHIKASCDFKTDTFKGKAKGDYDITADEISGDGEAELTSPLTLGSSGVGVTKATGKIEVKKNKIKRISGKGSAEVPFKGQRTFELSTQGAEIDIEKSLFTGTGKAKLIRPLTIEAGKATATLNSGEANVEVTKNKFIKAGLSAVKYGVQVPVGGQKLALSGTINTGSVNADKKVTFVADSSLDTSLTFAVGKSTITTETGTVAVDIANNVFKKLSIKNLKVAAKSKLQDADISVRGTVKQGELADSKVTFQGKLELTDTYSLTKGTSTIKLSQGEIETSVVANKFESAGIKGVKYDLTSTLGESDLALKGNVKAGMVAPSSFTLDADAELSSNCTITKGGTTVVVERGGKAAINLQNTGLESLSVSNLKFTVATKVAENPLSVSGKISTGSLTSKGATLSADITLSDTFNFKGEGVTGSVESGARATLSIKNNSFEGASLKKAKILATVTVGGNALGLKGELDAGVDKNGKIDFNGNVTLPGGATFQFGKNSVAIDPNASFDMELTKSVFMGANVKSLTAKASINAGGSTLALDGNLKRGSIDQNGKVTLGGDVKVTSDFTLGKGDFTATLAQNGQLSFDVTKSVFKSASLKNVTVTATAPVGGGTLGLKGSLTEGSVNAGGKVNVGGSVELVNTFTTTAGGAEISVKEKGKLSVDIKNSEFVSATIKQLEATVKTKVGSATIHVKGNIPSGSIDGSGNVDLDGDVSLQSNLVVGNVTIEQEGQVAVSVKKSAFQSATIKKLTAVVRTDVDGSPLALKGEVTTGDITKTGLVTASGSLVLLDKFTLKAGKTTASIAANAELKASVVKNKFDSASFTNLVVGFKQPLGKSTLNVEGKLSGSVTSAGKVSMNGSVKLLDDFTVKAGRVSATLAAEGKLKFGINNNEFAGASVEQLDVDADVDVGKSPMKLGGPISKGDILANGGLDMDAALKVVKGLQGKFGELSVAMADKGTVQVGLSGLSFTGASLQNVTLTVSAPVGDSTLDLVGTIQEASVDASGNIDLDAKIGIKSDFKVTKSPVTATLSKGGSVQVSVAGNKFKHAKVTSVKVAVDIEAGKTKVSLDGSIDNGNVDSSGKVDVNGGLKLTNSVSVTGTGGTFTLEKDGQFQIDVQKSKLVDASVKDLRATVETKVAGSTLKLAGGIKDGSVDGSGDVSLNAELGLDAPFTLKAGKATTTIAKDLKLGVVIKKSAFDSATFTGIKVGFSTPVGKSVLALEGDVSGSVDSKGLVTMNGSIKLTDTLTVKAGPATAKLAKGGMVRISVTKSEFTSATIEHVDIDADVDVAGSIMKLTGGADSGDVKASGGATINSILNVVGGFNGKAGKIDVGLADGGKIGLDIAGSSFNGASFKNIVLTVSAPVGDQTLTLEGTINQGGISGAGKVDLDAEIKLKDDFTANKKPISATLEGGGKVMVHITNSEFQSAEIKDIKVKVDATLGKTKLSVDGGISSGKVDNKGAVDIKADLKLSNEVTVIGGFGTATLAQGGLFNIDVQSSNLNSATISNLNATLNTVVAGNDLALTGSIKEGSVDSDGKISVEAKLGLDSPFTLKAGKATTTIAQGLELGLSVVKSAFQSARFTGLKIAFSTPVGKSVLALEGEVSGSVDSKGLVTMDGTIKLTDTLTVKAGPATAKLGEGGMMTISVTKSEFTSAAIQNVDLDVSVNVAGSTLKLTGGADSGDVKATGGATINTDLKVDGGFKGKAGSIDVGLADKGEVGIDLAGSSFNGASFRNIVLTVAAPVGGQTLSLEGAIHQGGISGDGLVDLDASIKLKTAFTARQKPVSATVEAGGKVMVHVSKSEFQSAEIEAVKVKVEVDLGKSKLGLDGEISTGSIDSKGKVSLNGLVKLSDNFTASTGNAKATIKKNAQLTVSITNSSLDEARLSNTKVTADITVQQSKLKLEGDLGGAIYGDGTVDFDGAVKTVGNCTVSAGPVTATLKDGGRFDLSVIKSEFQHATISDVQLNASVSVGKSKMLLKGGISSGKIDGGGDVDFDGGVELDDKFTLSMGKASATFAKGGRIGVDVKKSEFVSAKLLGLNINANLPIGKNQLDLAGHVQSGSIEGGKLTFTGNLRLDNQLTVNFGAGKAVVAPGVKLVASIVKNEFKWAELINAKVTATIPINGKTLTVIGSTTKCRLTGTKLDLDGDLKSEGDFTVSMGSASATLEDGATLGVSIKHSSFDYAKLKQVQINASIPIAGKTLKLLGEVKKGQLTGTVLDFDGSLTTRGNFTLKMGKATATMHDGAKLEVSVKENEFERAKLTTVTVDAKIPLAGKVLALTGKVITGELIGDELDLTGSLKTDGDFTLKMGKASATLKDGAMLEVHIKKNSFDYAKLTNVNVEASIPLAGKTLKLKGNVSDGTLKGDKLDLHGSLKTDGAFTLIMGTAEATLHDQAELEVDIKQSDFNYALLKNVMVDAKMTVAGKTLKVNGSVNNGRLQGDKLTLNAALKTDGNFTLIMGKATATLKDQSELQVSITNSKFDWAKLLNVGVEATLPVNGKTLTVKGDLKQGTLTGDGVLSFTGGLKTVGDFTLTMSKATATLKDSGELNVCVENNGFKWAELKNIVVLADVELAGSTLMLKGTLTKGRLEGGKLDIDGNIAVRKDFKFTMGKVSATVEEGSSLNVDIKKNNFIKAGFTNVKLQADVTAAKGTLKLKGALNDGSLEKGKVSFNGTIGLREKFDFSFGKITGTVEQKSELKIDVQKNTFKSAQLNGVSILADVDTGKGMLLLKGEVTTGKLEDGNIDFDGTISARKDFVANFSKVKATLQKGSALRVSVKKNSFDFAKFINVKVLADINIGTQHLLLEGSVQKGEYAGGKLDFNGSLKLKNDFTYTMGKVTAKIHKNGQLTVDVKASKFRYAELSGIQVDIDVDLGDDLMKLGGELSSGKYEDGKLDIKASIKLKKDFKYKAGPVEATLEKDSSLAINVEKSKFVWAKLAGVNIKTTIKVGAKKLELGGSIDEGKYEAGKIDFKGTIKLLKDFDYALSPLTAKLVTGGSLTVSVKNNKFEYAEISNITALVDITLGGKKLALKGTITQGKYDAAGLLTLKGGISMVGTFVLFEKGKFKATLTKASVEVDIQKSKLVSIEATGRADLTVNAGSGTNISGYLDITWKRSGSNDKFSGKGKLTVSMLKGKVTGTVDAELKEDGSWTISGKVTYKMNKFIKGEIGVKMDQDLDPELDGTLTVSGVQLLAGRDLFSIQTAIIPKMSVNVVVVAVPITLGFGVDFGMKVSMLPVTFGASIGIKKFRPLHNNVPDFNIRADLGTGLNLSMALKPYASLGIGVGGILDAGFKLTGGIELNCPITVNPYLDLKGENDKFSGEFGVNVKVAPSVTLSVQGSLYAAALGASVDHAPDWLKYEQTFDDLFTWEWNGGYKFGDAGPSKGASSAPQGGETSGSAQQSSEMPKDDSGITGFGSAKTASDDAQGPVIPASDTTKEEPGGGPMAEFQQKMEKAQKWAKHLGNVANLVGMVVSAVGLAATFSWLAPPIGPILGAVIGILMGGGPGAILSGLSSLMWLVGEGAAILWSLMPDWVKDIKAIIDGGATYAADKLYEWGAGNIDGTWWPVLEPMFAFCKGMAEKFVKTVQKIDGTPLGFVKGYIGFIISAGGSALDLMRAIGGSLAQLKLLVQKLVYDGKIVATNTNPDDYGKDPWKWRVDIPGLYSGGGHSDNATDWAMGHGISAVLQGVFGCTPNTNTGVDAGFDY